MPSFPRRRESRSVGTETYRENGFLRFCVLDSRFCGNDGILGFCFWFSVLVGMTWCRFPCG
ncbi:pilus assembly protein PilS [Neisseria meningitidis]|nr:pilus assembly protein PilS [Neisseria meningitidis]